LRFIVVESARFVDVSQRSFKVSRYEIDGQRVPDCPVVETFETLEP